MKSTRRAWEDHHCFRLSIDNKRKMTKAAVSIRQRVESCFLKIAMTVEHEAYPRLVDTYLHGHVESCGAAATVRADQSFVALPGDAEEQAHRVPSQRVVVVVRVSVHSLDRPRRVPRALKRKQRRENRPPTRHGARPATERDFLSQPVFKHRSAHRNTRSTRSLTHVTSPARTKHPNVIVSRVTSYALRALRFNCESRVIRAAVQQPSARWRHRAALGSHLGIGARQIWLIERYDAVWNSCDVHEYLLRLFIVIRSLDMDNTSLLRKRIDVRIIYSERNNS